MYILYNIYVYICNQKDRKCALPVITHTNTHTHTHIYIYIYIYVYIYIYICIYIYITYIICIYIYKNYKRLHEHGVKTYGINRKAALM